MMTDDKYYILLGHIYSHSMNVAVSPVFRIISLHAHAPTRVSGTNSKADAWHMLQPLRGCSTSALTHYKAPPLCLAFTCILLAQQ